MYYEIERRHEFPLLKDLVQAGYPIFNDWWETYIPEHRQVLERKIIHAFYMHEIGQETPDDFSWHLNQQLEEIMPYYNQLYASELIKFNPLLNHYITTQGRSIENLVSKANTSNDKFAKAIRDFVGAADRAANDRRMEQVVAHTSEDTHGTTGYGKSGEEGGKETTKFDGRQNVVTDEAEVTDGTRKNTGTETTVTSEDTVKNTEYTEDSKSETVKGGTEKYNETSGSNTVRNDDKTVTETGETVTEKKGESQSNETGTSTTTRQDDKTVTEKPGQTTTKTMDWGQTETGEQSVTGKDVSAATGSKNWTETLEDDSTTHTSTDLDETTVATGDKGYADTPQKKVDVEQGKVRNDYLTDYTWTSDNSKHTADTTQDVTHKDDQTTTHKEDTADNETVDKTSKTDSSKVKGGQDTETTITSGENVTVTADTETTNGDTTNNTTGSTAENVTTNDTKAIVTEDKETTDVTGHKNSDTTNNETSTTTGDKTANTDETGHTDGNVTKTLNTQEKTDETVNTNGTVETTTDNSTVVSSEKEWSEAGSEERSGNLTGDNTRDTSGSSDFTSSDKSREVTDTSHTEVDNQKKDTTSTTDIGKTDVSEGYMNISASALLNAFRETFLNIDAMIIKELETNFMCVY